MKAGGTTADGLFTVEDVECIAACTEAPCLQVNYRYCHRITHDEFDRLVDDLRAGRLDDEIPPHGTLARVRQHIPGERAAGPALPTGGKRAGVARQPARAPPPTAEGAAADGDRTTPKIVTLAARPRRRAHARPATSRTGGYAGLRRGPRARGPTRSSTR